MKYLALTSAIIFSLVLAFAITEFYIPIQATASQPVIRAEVMKPKPNIKLKTISPYNLISLQIPKNCEIQNSAGASYFQCSNQVVADFKITTDGKILKVSRINTQWDQWDNTINSIKIKTPLRREVELIIEK